MPRIPSNMAPYCELKQQCEEMKITLVSMPSWLTSGRSVPARVRRQDRYPR